jgi:1,4-alpha-glucan branching enzyme
MAKVRFEIEARGASKVFLAGDFTDWDAEPRRMRRSQRGKDIFSTKVDLEPGVYQYKYLVDGEWLTDPAARQFPNVHGTTNSVIEVAADGSLS